MAATIADAVKLGTALFESAAVPLKQGPAGAGMGLRLYFGSLYGDDRDNGAGDKKVGNQSPVNANGIPPLGRYPVMTNVEPSSGIEPLTY